MLNDGVRRVHGFLAQDEKKTGVLVTVRERNDGRITLNAHFEERSMTPTQARYLAEKLCELAARVEERIEEHLLPEN